MAEQVYLALLRGINVGGRNSIKMAELRICLQDAGLEKVSTYIQSGNIVFKSDSDDIQNIKKTIHNAIENQFGLSLEMMIFPRRFMEKVMAKSPAGFGEKPDMFKYDVLYLDPSVSPELAMNDIPVRHGVDRVWSGPGVIYFERKTASLTKSYLNKLASKAIYQKITIRNWRTTSRLVAMMGDVG